MSSVFDEAGAASAEVGGRGGRREYSRTILWALAAAAGLAVALTLWGALGESPAVGPFVSLAATGCGGRSVASGFAVADDLVVTAAHPVAGRTQVAVTDVEGRARHGFVVVLDPALDVAVVRVPGLGADPAVLASGDAVALAASGTPGVVASMSKDGGLVPKPAVVTRRVRAHIEDVYFTRRVARRALELSFDGGYGDSGAAVVNRDGLVVGMVFATSRSRDNVGYAVRAIEIGGVLSQVAELPRRTVCP